MKNMKKKIAAMLAAVTLLTVGTTAALADYGDAKNDCGEQPRYKVGQEVEVYNTFFHASTTRRKVLSCRKDENGVWKYEVNEPEYIDSDMGHGTMKISDTTTYSANAIQSS